MIPFRNSLTTALTRSADRVAMHALVYGAPIQRERAHVARRWRSFDEWGREITAPDDLSILAADYEREQAAEFRNDE